MAKENTIFSASSDGGRQLTGQLNASLFAGKKAERPQRFGVVARLGKRLLCRLLERLEHGEVELIDADDRRLFGRVSDRCPLSVRIDVTSPDLYQKLVISGSVGAAEAYRDGDWVCSDLVAFFRIIVMNPAFNFSVDKAWFSAMQRILGAAHWMRRNTLSGSRRNISEHYDLGNEFFTLFLDETMSYSCVIFDDNTKSLMEAAVAKNDRICRKLNLSSQTTVLEIGSGWGGFAMHAAGNYGCRVVTTTISKEQFRMASERVLAAGLEDRIEVVMCDYRKLEGKFDRLVSVEMIEAVGHQYLGDYMGQCSRLLKDDGMMLLQAITCSDQMYDAIRRSVDFIKRHIFPGSCIPSISKICERVASHTDLRLIHLEDISSHYARTLDLWRQNFHRNIESARLQGLTDGFLRMWDYYLAYCEAGFAERYVRDVQLILAKPLVRDEVHQIQPNSTPYERVDA